MEKTELSLQKNLHCLLCFASLSLAEGGIKVMALTFWGELPFGNSFSWVSPRHIGDIHVTKLMFFSS